MLIKLLILFFILLFIYQLYYYYNPIQEGLATSESSYKGYGNDPNILIYQNAGNISYLNDQIKICTSNSDQITSLTTQVNNIQKQVNAMATSQSSQYTSNTS
jgi:hypothetical protein